MYKETLIKIQAKNNDLEVFQNHESGHFSLLLSTKKKIIQSILKKCKIILNHNP